MPSMVEAVPLTWVLLVAGALFCIGLFGSLSRRNTIGILFGVELMLNAVNLNLIAFWRYLEPNLVAGQVFALFVIVMAAALAALYRWTRFGLETRAAFENETSAMLVGLSPNRLSMANTLIASVIVGALGVLVAPVTQLDAGDAR